MTAINTVNIPNIVLWQWFRIFYKFHWILREAFQSHTHNILYNEKSLGTEMLYVIGTDEQQLHKISHWTEK